MPELANRKGNLKSRTGQKFLVQQAKTKARADFCLFASKVFVFRTCRICIRMGMVWGKQFSGKVSVRKSSIVRDTGRYDYVRQWLGLSRAINTLRWVSWGCVLIDSPTFFGFSICINCWRAAPLFKFNFQLLLTLLFRRIFQTAGCFSRLPLFNLRLLMFLFLIFFLWPAALRLI